MTKCNILKIGFLAAAIGLAGSANAQNIGQLSVPDMSIVTQDAVQKSLGEDMRSFEKTAVLRNGVLVTKGTKAQKADRRMTRPVSVVGFAVQPYQADLQAPNIMPEINLYFPSFDINVGS